MRKLILIKHARPAVDPSLPPSQWKLSPAGRDSCTAFAAKLSTYTPTALVASREVKAQETAQLLAGELSVPMEVVDGLQEHDREDVPHMDTRDFLATMAIVFKQPHRRVLGRESADHARDRFLKALDGVLQRHPEGNIGVVSHGTVISLAISYHTGEDGYQLWRRMGLPSYAVLEMPSYKLTDLG